MSLFSMLSKKAPNRVFGSMLLGVLSGATYALLIPLMINALRPADARFTTVDSGPVTVAWLEVANAPVAALYATRVTKHNHSQRTGETLAPLSKDLSLPVNTTYDSDNYLLAATSVMNNPAYCGKTVIVCWTHHDIAQLAGAFGVRPQPEHWKEKTFDRLWTITYRNGHAELRDVPQRLLKGDAKR